MIRVGPATFALVVGVAACGPNLNDVRISECMHNCNVTLRGCLDKAKEIAPADPEKCTTDCLDCIDACVADLERTLK